jgi:hypothetical protein
MLAAITAENVQISANYALTTRVDADSVARESFEFPDPEKVSFLNSARSFQPVVSFE